MAQSGASHLCLTLLSLLSQLTHSRNPKMFDPTLIRLLFCANVGVLSLALYDWTTMPNETVALALGLSIAGTAASTFLLSIFGDLGE